MTRYKVLKPDLMEHTRAAVELVNRTSGDNRELAMYGFLSLFHPKLTHAQKRELVRK